MALRSVRPPGFAQQDLTYKPEEGASLRLLRWSPFVKGDEEQWLANTKKFTEATGVEVRVDKESWEDIRPKAAVAANVGSGPDLMLVWFDDPHQYPDKLLDVTELADYLGNKYGGWYDGPKDYATRDGKFVGLPLATIGNAIVYRESWVKEAGFSEFPKNTDDFLELCKALQKTGHPVGFTHGHGVGDGNNYAHWLLWSHGGKMVDENGQGHHQQPGDAEGHRIRDGALQDLHPRHRGLARRQQQPRLPGRRIVGHRQRHLGLLHGQERSRKTRSSPRSPRTSAPPTCRSARSASRSSCIQVTSAVIFKYTKYPERGEGLSALHVRGGADERLDHQVERLLLPDAEGLCQQPGLDRRSRHNAPYAKASETLRPNGYAGPLGYASAAVMADYVLVDMFAEAVTGQQTPQGAMERAEKRANRYYRV